MNRPVSRLAALLAAGQFVVTGELGPPKHGDGTALTASARELRAYCDAFNVTDNQTAVARLSSVAASFHVQQGGAEAILQMTCRDRNRIALQSDLLGAHSLGLRNVLCLSGDHVRFGNHPGSKTVYDIDSVQLIQMVRQMRDEQRFLSGDALTAPVDFWIGAVENPFADPLPLRVMRLEKKIEAGAQFIQTQAVFDLERFQKFMELVVARGLHERAYILAGVLPVRSAKALLYMQRHVAGMMIPDSVVARLQQAEDMKQAGLELCIDLCRQCSTMKGVAGIHIMPVGWEAALPRVMEGLAWLPRPQAPEANIAPLFLSKPLP